MISILLAVSLLGSCLAWSLVRLLGRASAGWLVALLPAGLFAGFLGFSGTIGAGRTVTERLPWAPTPGVELTLRLDGFAYLFCLLVTGVGTLVVIHAGGYVAERPAADRARFLSLVLLFMTAMLGAVLADDLLVLLLCWEATSLLSFLLIGFDVESPSARRSALMSLRVTAGGGLALLASILLIGVALDSYSLSGVLVAGGVARPLTGGLTIPLLLLTLPVASQLLPRAAYLSGAPIQGLDRGDPLAGVLDRRAARLADEEGVAPTPRADGTPPDPAPTLAASRVAE